MPYREPRSPWRLPFTLLAAVLFLLLLWQLAERTRSQALERLHEQVSSNVARYSLTLEGELEKFRNLPALLATNEIFERVLADPQNPALIDDLNRYLARLAHLTRASDIYLMATSGVTLAASNWRSERSFVGRNFSFRPYFQAAMRGEAGQYFALGSTSKKRGYFFSYPVFRGVDVIGAVVVKVDINEIERQWSDPLIDLLVTDIDDIVFISTRPEWKFRSLQNLSPADLKRIQQSLRYGEAPLASLPVVRRESLESGAELLVILEADDGSGELSGRQYLSLRRPVPGTELTVVGMARLDGVRQQVWRTLMLGAVLFGLLLVGLLLLQARMRIRREREQFREQATRALEANEARVRAILDNTRAGLVMLGGEGEIESANPTATALFGARPGALVGHSFETLLAEPDRPLCRRMLSEPASAEAGVSAPVVEVRCLRQDGGTVPVELTIVGLESQGERKFIVTLHDISERKAYEEELRRARDELEQRVEERTRDLQQANARLRAEVEEHRRTREELIQAAKMAVLGELSAGINHELNQPLTAIRAYADNGLAFLQRGQPERAEANLREIAELTARMAKIIAPLKVFSRKASGKAEPVALKAVREGAESVLYGRLHSGSMKLRWPQMLDELYVLGDMVRLEQVFVNLISNAMQATEGQSSPMLEIECTADEQQVVLRFRDNGPGIDAADPNRVFEPFYTTKQGSDGLGLGLSVSRRIVESLGGTLSAGNDPAGGAVFTLTLRRVQPG